MDTSFKLRAAAGHLASAAMGVGAALLGGLWVSAAGDPVAVPATIVVLALVALTPIAIRRYWRTRGEYIDLHVRAAARFLTTVGAAAVLAIGAPVLVSVAMEPGTSSWSSVLVLPFLGALVVPVVWAFLAVRAAVAAVRARTDPYPRWALPFAG